MNALQAQLVVYLYYTVKSHEERFLRGGFLLSDERFLGYHRVAYRLKGLHDERDVDPKTLWEGHLFSNLGVLLKETLL